MWCISKGYLMMSKSQRHREMTIQADIHISRTADHAVLALSAMSSLKYSQEHSKTENGIRVNGHGIVKTPDDSYCYLTCLKNEYLWAVVDKDTSASGDEVSSDMVLTQCLMTDTSSPYELATQLRYIKTEPVTSWVYYTVENVLSALEGGNLTSTPYEKLPGHPKPRYRVVGEEFTLIKQD